MDINEKLDYGSKLLGDIYTEVKRAMLKHKPLNSAHEGYAVILEELDELKEEVWKGGSKKRDIGKMQTEAIHVAAMAIRFIIDVANDDEVYNQLNETD